MLQVHGINLAVFHKDVLPVERPPAPGGSTNTFYFIILDTSIRFGQSKIWRMHLPQKSTFERIALTLVRTPTAVVEISLGISLHEK